MDLCGAAATSCETCSFSVAAITIDRIDNIRMK